MRLYAAVRALLVVGLLGFLLVALAAIDVPSIDWHDLSGWLTKTPPEDALVAVVRLLAMAASAVLLATAALYVLASVGRLPTAAVAIGHLTLPVVRRAIDGALAGTVVLATLSPLAARASEPVAPTTSVVTLVPPAYIPIPAGDGSELGQPVTAPEAEAMELPAPDPRAGVSLPIAQTSETYLVQRGDNLWSIAASIIVSDLGRRPTDLEVAPYWRKLIVLNLPHLSSGDPDLIYAGELLELPTEKS